MVSISSVAAKLAESFIAGAIDFIAKPCKGETVVELVNKHLSEDIEIHIEKVKSWRTEHHANFIRNYEEHKKEFDENKFSEELLGTLKSCIDESLSHGRMLDYNDLEKLLLNTTKEYLNPSLKIETQPWKQTDIEELIKKCTKQH